MASDRFNKFTRSVVIEQREVLVLSLYPDEMDMVILSHLMEGGGTLWTVDELIRESGIEERASVQDALGRLRRAGFIHEAKGLATEKKTRFYFASQPGRYADALGQVS